MWQNYGQKTDQIPNPKNPTPPTVNALLKLHKPNVPIRPVVNNKNAPCYKIAKKLNKILNHNLHLDNQYTATNSNSAVTKLKISPNHRLLTLDIKDLYVNIPIRENIKITKNKLLKNSDTQTTNQVTTLLEIILNQNYFSFLSQIYQPDKGVAMAPLFLEPWRRYFYNT